MPNSAPPAEPRLSREELLLEEYRANREFVARNEAAGETRVNLFLTLNSALVAVLALGDGRLLTASDGPASTVLVLLLVALLLVGRTVLTRTVRRNVVTTLVLHEVDRIRAELARRHPDVQPFLAWTPKGAGGARGSRPRRDRLRLRDFLFPAKGGLAELVALLNACLCGALAGTVALRALVQLEMAPGPQHTLWAAAATVAGFLAGWAWHVGGVNRHYAGAEADGARRQAEAEAHPARLGVGAG